jgi:hypothetical protein
VLIFYFFFFFRGRGNNILTFFFFYGLNFPKRYVLDLRDIVISSPWTNLLYDGLLRSQILFM